MIDISNYPYRVQIGIRIYQFFKFRLSLIKECLRRELLEEFGIDTCVKDFIGKSLHSYSYGSIELLAYRVDHLSGEFKLNDHEEIKWITPEELGEYDLAEADKPIVEKLRRK